MSTLKVDTIRDNGAGFNDVVTFANSGGTENGRLCRAFVNFDGTGAVAIRANFNVNSITDNGTGDYTANFANAMSDANYAAVIIGRRPVTVTEFPGFFTTTLTTGSIRMGVVQPGTAFYDTAEICVAIFR